jgi:hypothetical protein
MATIVAEPAKRTSDDRQIAEKKRLALAYLTEAWEGAEAEGVDSEILAHAALFRAFADLIETYGEEAVAGLAKTFPAKIMAFEFSLHRSMQ